MKIDQKITIGEIVANDFRSAAVFAKYGIDFCCKGDRTIDQVCEKNNVSREELVSMLEKLPSAQNSEIDFKSWPIDLLADYIEKTHHRYVAEKTPILQQFLEKLSKVHGQRHPELLEINKIFNNSAKDLAAHMKKEELILFPFIKRLVSSRGQEITPPPHFGTVENPVNMMKEEHSVEGERFRQISELSDGYTVPEDGCNTYRVTFAMLKDFEADLHKHIHLENNILFPAAISLEKVAFAAV